MANKLIQWNCRGLKANFDELLLLLTGLCPIICLLETFIKPTDNLIIRGYTLYNHIQQAGDRASGGSFKHKYTSCCCQSYITNKI